MPGRIDCSFEIGKHGFTVTSSTLCGFLQWNLDVQVNAQRSRFLSSVGWEFG
jgi:hypothetical protein